MAVSRESINAFAKAMKSADDTSTLWTPRPQQWSQQMGTVTKVDPFNSVVEVALNGGDTTVSGVRYSHAYSSDNPPQVGDTFWGNYNGKTLLAHSRQDVPSGAVTFP